MKILSNAARFTTLHPSYPRPMPEPSNPDSRWLGVVTVLATLVGWCSIPIFLRHFSHSIDPWTSNGWRYGFAALLWLPVILLGFQRRDLPKGLWKAALVPAAFNSLGQICFTYAHYQVDPALLTFGLRVQIIFVTLGALLLFPAERLIVRKPLFILGIALVFGGTLATVLADSNITKGATTLGVLLAVGAGALFACYGLSVRHYMHGIGSLTAFAAISQYTAIVQIILMLLLGRSLGAEAVTHLALDQFLLLLLSAVIGIALGHVFYYISIKQLGVAVSAGVIQLQPFGVGIASFYFFEEKLTPLQWTMGSLAVCGAALILRVQHKAQRAIRSAAAEQQACEDIAPIETGTAPEFILEDTDTPPRQSTN